MNRTYILETDRATRQQQAATRPRSYFQPVHVIEPVSENGTVRLNEVTLRVAHGKDEPKSLGNLNRTKRRIWTGEAVERTNELIAYPVQRFTRKQRKGIK